MSSRRGLRAEMRSRRRALAARERERLAERLARHLIGARELRASRDIACYLPCDGEMDLRPLIARLWASHRRVWLPALHGPRLWFLPLEPDTPLALNRYSIPEPDLSARRRLAPRALDLVLMPLVAFDAGGNRLGMGGGFYDRTFAYLRGHPPWSRPRLVGVAYGFQRVGALERHPWDVPLAAVATEAGLERFARR